MAKVGGSKAVASLRPSGDTRRDILDEGTTLDDTNNNAATTPKDSPACRPCSNRTERGRGDTFEVDSEAVHMHTGTARPLANV